MKPLAIGLGRSRFLVLAFLALAAQQPADAQCPVPDQLDGPCCAIVQPLYPQVPDFGQGSLAICYRDCGVEQVTQVKARFDLTATTSNGPCDAFTKRIVLRNGANAPIWRGRLRFNYSRSWVEADSSGLSIQVWRYLVNGDMRPTANLGPAPCPRPPCAAPNNNLVRFTGYVDYARTCGTTMRAYAWMLTHACDALDHLPGFPRAGAFHPDRSYTFVGPAAGFVVSPLVGIEAGITTQQAVRRSARIPGTVVCETREPLLQADIQPQFQTCFCGTPTPQHTISLLRVLGTCGTNVQATGGPLLPGFVSMGIGTWTSPLVFPGVEELRWNTGNYDYLEGCTGNFTNELFFGVTTLGGFPANEIDPSVPGGVGLPLLPTFVDQGNSVAGSASLTTANVPFRTEHVLNLNFP